MKSFRIALLAYCIIAVVVLAFFIFRSASTAGESGAQLKRTRAELAEAIEDSRRKERVLTDLQTEQRDNRLAYDGPKAIEMSLKVQLALEEYETASAKRSALDQAELQLYEARKKQQIKLVPFIALLLLHLLGAAYFIRPPRQSVMPR